MEGAMLYDLGSITLVLMMAGVMGHAMAKHWSLMFTVAMPTAICFLAGREVMDRLMAVVGWHENDVYSSIYLASLMAIVGVEVYVRRIQRLQVSE